MKSHTYSLSLFLFLFFFLWFTFQFGENEFLFKTVHTKLIACVSTREQSLIIESTVHCNTSILYLVSELERAR